MRPSTGLAALSFWLLQIGACGFGILPGKSLNHLEITNSALLNATVQVCRRLALSVGTDFTFPPQPFTAEAVAVACSSPKSTKRFLKSIKSIKWRNVRVDLRHALNASFHFDDELFLQGRKIITTGISAVKVSNKQGNFEAAREKLGEICHPLQDFYSHSNWVEIGNQRPNPNLIRSDVSIGNIAAVTRATCRNCDGDDCTNNILQDILREKILTSGYFDVVPFLSTKPAGKCSHGGLVDQTSVIEPKGGINKDSQSSSHGHLHTVAAGLAIAATEQLLEDIRAAAGDTDFLQMLGISKGSGKALCIVMDTTGTMRDDIEAVKTVTFALVNSRVGTSDEPSVYILVPFNDPGLGPLIRTTDSALFKTQMNALTAEGGGDFPEPSLSALQLALTGAPPESEIFLFTDAVAKDGHLKSTVTALIERTKTVINFMLTGVLGRRRRRQSDEDQMTGSDVQLYRDLAQVSGGQAIEVSKSQLLEATSIITESSSFSSLVTLFQADRSPGRADDFSFLVDESVQNLTIYVTGRSLTFTLISPSGASLSSTDNTGSLGTIQSVGNFQTLRLNTQVGRWEMRLVSNNPYSLKVIGQSNIDFLFDFVETSRGTFTGFDILDSRPRAGVNGSLMLSITGGDTATVTEVALVDVSGSGEVNATVESLGGGDFLAQFDTIPSGEFMVRVKGTNTISRDSSSNFQRQSPTSLRGSNLTVTSDSESVFVPGSPFIVPFIVTTGETDGNFTIRATNDKGFDSTFPTSLSLQQGGSANGTVSLIAPLNTPSGSEVTLTIEAEAPGATDTNYVVLRFSIVNMVTDFTPPVCLRNSLQSNCPETCHLSTWALSVTVTDGADGSSIGRVGLERGNGTLTSTVVTGADGVNATLVSYSASCCSPEMELVVVDGVGNVGSCFFTSRDASSGRPTPAPVSEATKPKSTWSGLLGLSMMIPLCTTWR